MAEDVVMQVEHGSQMVKSRFNKVRSFGQKPLDRTTGFHPAVSPHIRHLPSPTPDADQATVAYGLPCPVAKPDAIRPAGLTSSRGRDCAPSRTK